MNIISELFGKSPFKLLVDHSRKVYACVKMIRPLLDALIAEDYGEIRRLQDQTSKLEFEADNIKHVVRNQLSGRYFMPVDRTDLTSFLHSQDTIADKVEDFAVILLIRKTKMHPELQEKFIAFSQQVVQVSETLLTATEELYNLAETSFGGAEAKAVLKIIENLCEEEWKADKMARDVSMHIYSLESEIDPITIMFYEKMLVTLGAVANAAENAGDMIRNMIVK